MVTLYTVITNNYVELMPQEYIPGFRYVCFTDGTVNVPDPWISIKIPELVSNKTRLSRHPKILSHKYFSDGEVTVYFDGKEKLDISKIISAINLTQEYEFISLLHPWRHTYCDEMIWMFLNGLITKEEVVVKTKSLIQEKYCFGDHICTLNHCIIRKNTEYVKKFELEWWGQYKSFKSYANRDQLPFGITYNYLKSDKHVFLDREVNLSTGEVTNRNIDNTLPYRPSNEEISELQAYLTDATKVPLIGELINSKPL